jgi:hypothetical protein
MENATSDTANAPKEIATSDTANAPKEIATAPIIEGILCRAA